MTFIQAHSLMMKGQKITRPNINGYWYFDIESQKVMVHTNEGNNLPLTDFKKVAKDIISKDWLIYGE